MSRARADSLAAPRRSSCSYRTPGRHSGCLERGLPRSDGVCAWLSPSYGWPVECLRNILDGRRRIRSPESSVPWSAVATALQCQCFAGYNEFEQLEFDQGPRMPERALKLLSSMATRELLIELIAQYERKTGQAVTAEAAGGVDVAKRVRAGEAVDVIVLSNTAIDSLIAAGSLLPESRVDLVRSGVAIAVREGAAEPDVASEEAVKRAVLSAKTLSYSTGPSGVYLEKLFERWGILEEIRGRIVVPPPGVPVGSLVAGGKVELGFQQLSELMSLPGIKVIGPLPAAIQTITLFSGGISPGCERPELGRALLDYMAAPSVASVKQRFGMEAA